MQPVGVGVSGVAVDEPDAHGPLRDPTGDQQRDEGGPETPDGTEDEQDSLIAELIEDAQGAQGAQDPKGKRHHQQNGNVGCHEQQQTLGHDTSPQGKTGESGGSHRHPFNIAGPDSP